MKTIKPSFIRKAVLTFLLPLSLLLFINPIILASGNETIRFNNNFKIKRIAPNKVYVYQKDTAGEKLEYQVDDFNADVLLLIYRNITPKQMTSSLSKKYHLDETTCRRQIKISLNTLAEWDIIERGDL